MRRPYLKVDPGTGTTVPQTVPDAIASLHKISRNEPESILRRLNPFSAQPPLRFEFVALSEGEDWPIRFYYGADDHLDALEQRLTSIYPASSSIERTEVDITKRLIRPVEFTREEFAHRLEDGRLYSDPVVQSESNRARVSDGGALTVDQDTDNCVNEIPESARSLEQTDTDSILDDIDLASPRSIPENEPPATLEGPTETTDGHILARPALSEVEPIGVEWWAKAERRKDWMTTLTEFTDLLDSRDIASDDQSSQTRLPLTPLVNRLAEATHPIAFQVVFQRRSDWSNDARRRSGELLHGSDTLLQRILGMESTGTGRTSASNHRYSSTGGTSPNNSSPERAGSPNSVRSSRPAAMEEASRYDLIRSNSPKRTFSANLRLLVLTVDDDDRAVVENYLDPLRSVFDLVDGEFYEMEGRRLRSHGYLQRAGQRHARDALEHFSERSIVTGGKTLAITNRSETRPDLVLNGNELANFMIIPPVGELANSTSESGNGPESAPAAEETSIVEDQEAEHDASSGDTENEDIGEGPLSTVPESVLHREEEVTQLSHALHPLTRERDSDAVLLTGPPGSGKTCIAKHTVDQLCRNQPGVDAAYINCWEDHSLFQTLYRILDEVEGATDIHRQSTATDIILDRLREYDEQHCLLILDDVDQLDDDDFIYDLLNLPRFSLVLVVNREEDLLEGLDDRLASRLGGCERIHIDEYSVDQLVDILAEHADAEGAGGDIERSGYERIAEAANGDARVAIAALRISVRSVSDSKADGISQDIVERVLPEARQEVQRRPAAGLSPHHKALLQVIEEYDRIAPRELLKEYQDRVDDPRSNRTARKYLKQLERKSLITAEGSTRDRRYQIL